MMSEEPEGEDKSNVYKKIAEKDFYSAAKISKSVYEKNKNLAVVRRLEYNEVDVSIIIVCSGNINRYLKLAESFRWESSISIEVVFVNTFFHMSYGEFEIPNPKFTIVLVNEFITLSAGRNLGAAFARGKYLFFSEIEWELDEAYIRSLYDTCNDLNAVAVRGCIDMPEEFRKSSIGREKLMKPSPAIIDNSSLTIWNTKQFNAAGGFDTLLKCGGFELFSRMYRWHGPQAFLCQPMAKIDGSKIFNKITDEFTSEYMDYLGVDSAKLRESYVRSNSSLEESAMLGAYSEYTDYLPQSSPLVSIITTARNAGDFIQEYKFSLDRQTYQNFEVIFVDDGSDDATVEVVKQLWRNDSRLKLVPLEWSVGRSAALNEALKHARSEICLIADVDDLMLAQRLQWTVRYFEEYKESSCVSFYAFNENATFVGTPPLSPYPVSLRLRRYLGMPACFPSFAFKPSSFPLCFNSELEAGVDCDWLLRNFDWNNTLEGHMLPLRSTYYRLHEQQISSRKNAMQRDVAMRHIRFLHRSFLSIERERDDEIRLLLAGWLPVQTEADIEDLYEYVYRFRQPSDACSSDQVGEVREYLLKAVQRLHVLHTYRIHAEENARLTETLHIYEKTKFEWWEPQLKLREARIVELQSGLDEFVKTRSEWYEPELIRRECRIRELEQQILEITSKKSVWRIIHEFFITLLRGSR